MEEVVPCKRVAVIGAGVSGLPTIKQCLEEGLQPVCYEMRSDLGGLWNYVDEVVKGRSTVMKNTVMNTSKETSCYSDFPVPGDFPVFLPWQKVMEYLRMYSSRFGLEQYIRYNMEVTQLIQDENFSSTGRWRLTVKDVNTGEESTELFDGVFVCNGHHALPITPKYPGQDVFKGIQMHVIEYRTWKGFENKRVMLVGLSDSSVDTACELCKVCEEVIVSTRRGSWMVNRLGSDGQPFDIAMFRRWINNVMGYLPALVRQYLMVSMNSSHFNHELFGIEPEFSIESQNAIINDELPGHLFSGKVKIREDVEKLTENSIVFTDGKKMENVDVVIYGTGYEFDYSFIKAKEFEKGRKTDLFKFVFSPEIHPPTLAVIGGCQVFGVVSSASEMQARWATRVFKGDVKLPSREVMYADLKAHHEVVDKLVDNVKCRVRVGNYMAYMDYIGEQIGCKPDIKSRIMSDPRLAWALFFGPTMPSHYRLDGPGKWAPARQTILSVWDRIAQPLKTRKIVRGEWRIVGTLLKIFIVVFLLLWFWIL